MKYAAYIFGLIALASAAKAWSIYGGVDNGPLLALYVGAALVCTAIAILVGLISI